MRQQVDSSSNELIMTGWTSASRERDESGLRLWFAPSDHAALSRRIEFRPKGFFKLALEADETRSGSVQLISNRSNDEPQ